MDLDVKETIASCAVQESYGPRSGPQGEYAPIATTCLYENDTIRLWRQFIKPSERIGVHEHQNNYWLLEAASEAYILGSGHPKGQEEQESTVRIEAKRGKGYFVRKGKVEDAATPSDSPSAYDAYVVEILEPNPSLDSSREETWFEDHECCLTARHNSPASTTDVDCFVLQLSSHSQVETEQKAFHEFVEAGGMINSEGDILVLQLKGAQVPGARL